jgi:hypothetical protein
LPHQGPRWPFNGRLLFGHGTYYYGSDVTTWQDLRRVPESPSLPLLVGAGLGHRSPLQLSCYFCLDSLLTINFSLVVLTTHQMIDVEVERPSVKELWSEPSD